MLLLFAWSLTSIILPTWWELLPQNENSKIKLIFLHQKHQKQTLNWKVVLSIAPFFFRDKITTFLKPRPMSSSIVTFQTINQPQNKKSVLPDSLSFLFKVKIATFSNPSLSKRFPITKTLRLALESKSGVATVPPYFSSKAKITTYLKSWSWHSTTLQQNVKINPLIKNRCYQGHPFLFPGWNCKHLETIA